MVTEQRAIGLDRRHRATRSQSRPPPRRTPPRRLRPTRRLSRWHTRPVPPYRDVAEFNDRAAELRPWLAGSPPSPDLRAHRQSRCGDRCSTRPGARFGLRNRLSTARTGKPLPRRRTACRRRCRARDGEDGQRHCPRRPVDVRCRRRRTDRLSGRHVRPDRQHDLFRSLVRSASGTARMRTGVASRWSAGARRPVLRDADADNAHQPPRQSPH